MPFSLFQSAPLGLRKQPVGPKPPPGGGPKIACAILAPRWLRPERMASHSHFLKHKSARVPGSTDRPLPRVSLEDTKIPRPGGFFRPARQPVSRVKNMCRRKNRHPSRRRVSCSLLRIILQITLNLAGQLLNGIISIRKMLYFLLKFRSPRQNPAESQIPDIIIYFRFFGVIYPFFK